MDLVRNLNLSIKINYDSNTCKVKKEWHFLNLTSHVIIKWPHWDAVLCYSAFCAFGNLQYDTTLLCEFTWIKKMMCFFIFLFVGGHPPWVTTWQTWRMMPDGPWWPQIGIHCGETRRGVDASCTACTLCLCMWPRLRVAHVLESISVLNFLHIRRPPVDFEVDTMEQKHPSSYIGKKLKAILISAC